MLSVPIAIDDPFLKIAASGRNHGSVTNQHAMLISYFDDSSDEKREQFFATGGLVAGEERWKQFYVPWGVATINLTKPFRSTECESQDGQFEGWSKDQSNELMKRLVTVICDLRLSGFASVVPVPAYREVFPDSEEYDPYLLSVKHTMIAMAELGSDERKKFGLGGMECWFEDGPKSLKIQEIYQQLKSLESWNLRDCLSGFHLGGKKVAPLQAADLIAREAYKHIRNFGGSVPTRIPVKRMGQRINFTVWRKEQFVYLKDHGGPENLELLTRWDGDAPPFEVHWDMV